jgi:hypothetical protein
MVRGELLSVGGPDTRVEGETITFSLDVYAIVTMIAPRED